MTRFSRRSLGSLLSFLALAALPTARAQVGGQTAPVLQDPLFKQAKRGPANAYVLPGDVLVSLVQRQGYLLSATVQAKYDPAAQAAANPLRPVTSALGVLSGFGEGLAQPLEQFLSRPDVVPRLATGITIQAEPFAISARQEGGMLKLILAPSTVPASAFASVNTALPHKNAANKNPVVLRVYSDFQCPYCQKFEAETLPTLLAKLPDDVRIEFHQFPLEQIHPLARPSAEASECAAQQGKFWEYKDALFADRSWLASNPQEVFVRLAGKVGLNGTTFQKCVQARGGKAAVDAGMAEAMRLGVNGTPTVFVNGFRAGNPYDAAGLLQLVNFARAAASTPNSAAPTPAPASTTATPATPATPTTAPKAP